MVDTAPLECYIKARDKLINGEREEALRLLSESIGAEKATEFMEENLKELVEINPAVLTLIIHESKGDPHGR